MNDRTSACGPTAPGAKGRPDVPSIVRDVLTLFELQCQLAALDVRESAARTRQAVVLSAIGLTLLLSATSVGLAAGGLLLAERLAWPMWAALGAPAAGAMLLSGLLLTSAATAAKKTADVFSRSGEEFRQNIESVKRSLEGDERENSALTH